MPPGGRGDDDSSNSGSSFPISKGQLGVWILLTAVIMLFAGLSSAYIVLRGVPAWQRIELPWLLWPNTAILLLSSIAIDISRRAIRRNDLLSMKRWLATGGILGLVFLVGQLAAWRQLVAAGVYLPSTLQSGFFYILTGLHGLHLLGGVVALGLVLGKAIKDRLTAFNYEPLKLGALYWHVMDALWVYLFLLLLLL
jgi:cytochrome c oxidase subunit 3